MPTPTSRHANRLAAAAVVALAALVGTCQVDELIKPAGGGVLTVTPASLAESAAAGSVAIRRLTVEIDNRGAGSLGWTASRTGRGEWLSLAPSQGDAPGQLTVSADPRGLPLAVYRDTVVVSSTAPGRGSRQVPLEFRIHPCVVASVALEVDTADALGGADCAAPHRPPGHFAKVYSFSVNAGDSVSVELTTSAFGGYLVLSPAATGAPSLAQAGTCVGDPAGACLVYQLLPSDGAYVLEVTTAAPEQVGAYSLRMTQPRAPLQPAELIQLQADSTTVIATGGSVPAAALVVRGAAEDPDSRDTLRLEVEIQPIGAPFTGVPTATSAPVVSGRPAVAHVAGLADHTDYRWRARTVDQTGRASPWAAFGANSEAAPDFSVAIAHTPVAPTALGQFQSDGATAIVVGGSTEERTVVFQATVADADAGESLRLEVEVKRVEAGFENTPTASSVHVGSGAAASVAVGGLSDNAAYHWQARAVDQTGRAGPWAAFGGNAEPAPDFRIALAPSQLVFSQQPTSTAAGSPIAPAVTVAALDAGGSPIASFSGAVSIGLDANPVGGTLTGTDTVPAVAGVATFGDLRLDRMGAGYTLQARYGQLTVTSDAFSVRAGAVSAARSAAAAAPTTITAGTGTSTITVTARDAHDNPVSGATVVLAATGTGNTITQPAGPTNASGVATGTLRSTVAGAKTVSATVSGVVVTQKPVVTVASGPVSATRSTVTAAPTTIIAGTGTSTITVTARDAHGNPVSAATVVLAATGAGNTLTQPAGPTNASGVATGILRSTVAGAKVVSATINGVAATPTATVTVTAGAVSAARSTVAAAPATITAGTQTSTITVTARDANGNVVSGATVVLAATGTGNTLTQPAGPTSASGVATGTLRSTVAGTKTVSATINGVAVTQKATVSVRAGPVSAARSTVTAAPATIAAGTGVSTITVTARDANGNPVSGATVVLAASPVTGNVLTQPGAPTNASGVAAGTLRSTVRGAKTVSATINGVAVTQKAVVTVS